MKNTFLKTISGAALAIFMLAMFAQVQVSAQILQEVPPGQSRDLEGSWTTQVTFRNCQTGAAIRTFPAMNTFMRGGTMQEFGVGSAPLTRGPGHGVWSHQSGQRYSSNFQFFRFNADGTFAQTVRVRRQIELSQSGNNYTATATSEVFDTTGNLVMTGCATEVGTRFE